MTDPLREAAQAVVELLPELAAAFHQVGSLRDHADPKDKTGWNLHGIETCEDVYCVEALALTDALRASLAAPAPAPALDRELIHDLRAYAKHAFGCSYSPTYPDQPVETCDCGFDDVLDRYDAIADAYEAGGGVSHASPDRPSATQPAVDRMDGVPAPDDKATGA